MLFQRDVDVFVQWRRFVGVYVDKKHDEQCPHLKRNGLACDIHRPNLFERIKFWCQEIFQHDFGIDKKTCSTSDLRFSK